MTPTCHNKPFQQMTTQELQEELLYWQQKIEAQNSWGGALSAAIEFTHDIERILDARANNKNNSHNNPDRAEARTQNNTAESEVAQPPRSAEWNAAIDAAVEIVLAFGVRDYDKYEVAERIRKLKVGK